MTGINRLLKLLVDQDVGKAVCESTGGDQRQLDLPLASPSTETEIPVHLAHPLRARAFARACGHEAETDPRDAQVLSSFGSAFQENCTRRPEPELEELPDLLRRRRQLVEQKVQEPGRMDQMVSPAVAESTNRPIAWLEEEITKLDQELPQNRAALAQRAPL